MPDSREVLDAVEEQFLAWHAVDPTWPVRFVAGRPVDGDCLILLFQWNQLPEIFGCRINLTRYAALFGPSDAKSLATNFVTNDLAGPPGEGVFLDVDWARGLVPASDAVRWVWVERHEQTDPDE